MKEVVRPSRRRSIRDLDRFCSSALLKADWVLRAWNTRLWVLSAHWRWPSSVVCYLGTYPLSPEFLSAWAILIQSTDAYAKGVRRPEPPIGSFRFVDPSLRCESSTCAAQTCEADPRHRPMPGDGPPVSRSRNVRPCMEGPPPDLASSRAHRRSERHSPRPVPLTHGSTPGPCPTLRG